MDDQRLEELVRRTLRSDADALPFRLTSADVRGRLQMTQRRWTVSRALGGLAAALVIVAGGLIVFATRPVIAPVAGSPTPSAIASPSPSASTSPQARAPLGAADTMVLYRFAPGFELSAPPDVVLFALTKEGTTLQLGTIRGSTLPAGATINTEDAVGSRVRVSETGYAAVRYVVGEEATSAGHAIYDLQRLDAAPFVVDTDGEALWGPDGKLAIVGNETTIVDVRSRSVFTIRRPADVSIRGAWAADGSGLLATHELAVEPVVRYEAGVLSLDGRFTRAETVPPLYQATGLDRPLGARGETAGRTCDQLGSPPPADDTACYAVGQLPDGTSTIWLTGRTGKPFPNTVHWSADGRALWAVAANPARRGAIELFELTGQDRVVETARTGVRTGSVFLAALSSRDTTVVLLAPENPDGMLIKIDTNSGSVAYAGSDDAPIHGFAGWARAQEPYPAK